MLSDDIKRVIEQNTIGSVATVSDDGRPCVSPKGTFIIWDDATLVFSNIRSPGTVRNLVHNPAVEVVFLDIFHRTGCRIAGLARYVERERDTAGQYLTAFRERWPMLAASIEGFVVISVTKASHLTSPVYDIGMKRRELADYWLAHYMERLSGP